MPATSSKPASTAALCLLFLATAVRGTVPLQASAPAVVCTEAEAKLVNILFDRAAVDAANLAVREAMPKTVGRCPVDAAYAPCQNLTEFPIEKSGPVGSKVEVDYLAYLSTLNMTNITFRCDSNSSTSIGKVHRDWFVELDGHFKQLVVHAVVHLFKSMPSDIDVSGLTFHIVGRVVCHDGGSSIGIELDPMTDSLSTSPIKVKLPAVGSVDVTSEVASAAKSYLSAAVVKLPQKLVPAAKQVCKLAPDVALQRADPTVVTV
mmetsp:Transcript_75509/g.179356  ORF Transcript_75509/g.179356 Transcript_75509/m.179356 type:complete len:262 (-) Transcript_75509:76-861(-)